jgi:hypothetical protein
MLTDRRADATNQTTAFHSFASAPKNSLVVKYQLFTGLQVTKLRTVAAMRQPKAKTLVNVTA